MIRRRRPSSPAPGTPAPPLDDDDLLREILLRLPPQPSSLPRASIVCKRWRRLASDPGFLRSFRAHHRNPPLLGVFSGRRGVFTPTLDPPDRIPAARFSLPPGADKEWNFLGCRHGLALLINLRRHEAVVCDPVTGGKRCVAFPPGFELHIGGILYNAAVLCADGDAGHVHGDCHLSPFKLVVVTMDSTHTHVVACVYESRTRVWGNLIPVVATSWITVIRPCILVGNALCWALDRGDILEFDLEKQSLAVIEKPTDTEAVIGYARFQILRIEQSRLGLATLIELSLDIWERKANSDGVVGWVLQKTIELDKLLPLGSSMKVESVWITGFDEDNNVIFLSTVVGVFMVQLESMQFRNISKRVNSTCHPYRNFYAAGRRIGGGDVGAENAEQYMR